MRALFKKLRFINWGCVGPVFIYLGIAIGLVAGAITLERRAHHAAPPSEKRLSAVPNDALTYNLVRCQSLGAKAENDQSCIGAWAENRRRFFGDHPEPDKAFRP